jgi:phage-related protein
VNHFRPGCGLCTSALPSRLSAARDGRALFGSVSSELPSKLLSSCEPCHWVNILAKKNYAKILIMGKDTEWKILFYLSSNGDSPVREFLRNLDKKARARFGWSIEQLRTRNVQARPPLVKHLDDKIWELREESDTNIFRILFAFHTGRRIVLLHAFMKKTQKTPREEIDIAKRRLADFIERKGTQ